MAGRRPPVTIRAPATTPAVTDDSTRTRCRGLASGPIVVSSAIGSPTTNLEAWQARAETASSYRLRGASTRDMGSEAPLPGVGKPQPAEFGGGRVQVDVVEHDRGRLPAELEAHRLERLAADRGEPPRGRGRAGHRHGVPHTAR